MDPSAPGWYPDPYGRHERRYWSGVRWSRHVEDAGARSEDPTDSGGSPVTGPPEPQAADDEWDFASRSGWRGHGGGAIAPADTRWSGVVRHRRLLAVAAAAVVVVVAGTTFALTRGGSDSDELMVALVKNARENAAGTITDQDGRCMAEAVLQAVGRERLVELGVLDGADPTLAVSPDERAEVLPKALECLDDPTLLRFMEATAVDVVPGLTRSLASCVFDGWRRSLGRPRLEDLYARLARPDPPELDTILNANEFDMAMRGLTSCQEGQAKDLATASSTTAPATTTSAATKAAAATTTTTSTTTTRVTPVKTATIEDTKVGTGPGTVQYTGGSWTRCGGCSVATPNSSYRYGYVAGQSFTVRFEGVQLKVYAPSDSSGGTAQVTVDGHAARTPTVRFETSGTPADRLQWDSGILPAGPHTVVFTIQPGDDTVVLFDRAEVYTAGL